MTVRVRFELVALTAGVAALAVLCWRFGLTELGAALLRVSPRSLLTYLAFGAAARLGYALRWRLVARTLGSTPGLTWMLGARLAGDATGSLLPTGRISGDPLRAALVYGDGVSGTQASAGVAIDRIIEMLSNIFCAVAYVTVFSLARASGAERATHVMFTTMGLLLIALIVPLAMLRRGRRPLAPFYRLASGRSSPRWLAWAGAMQRTETHVMRFFQQHPAVFIQGLAGSLVIEALIICEYHFLLKAFGLMLDLPSLLLTLVASGVSRAVPTPAGLGALEAGQVTAVGLATGQPGLGFVVGFVLRLHETMWTGIGLVVLSFYGAGLARLRGALWSGWPAS